MIESKGIETCDKQ